MNRLEQVEKIASSETLQGSDTLCHLLRYLAQHSPETNGRSVKEYQIATEALGRSSDFDPRIDSTVRVAVARLRTKLDEYYSGEGTNDPVLVEIPKGHYRAVFHDRRQKKPGANGEELAPASTPRRNLDSFSTLDLGSGRGLAIVAAVSLVLIVSAALLGAFAGYKAHSAAASRTPPPAVLQQFWSGFAATPENPIVVYSNAQFVGRAHSTGLRYFNPAVDPSENIIDTYTGVGEVVAVHTLGRTFWQLGRDIEVKRSGLLGWDNARNASLIFVGGPFENLSVRELRKLRDESNFIFEPVADPGQEYGSVLVNRNPLPGERPSYAATQGRQGRRDYAIVQMAEGFTPGRRILILAGVSTQGTEGAVDFVCRANKLEELLAKLGVGPNDPLGPFESVLEIDISGGVPIDSRIVALRNHSAEASSQAAAP
jgi:hypothetical protein